MTPSTTQAVLLAVMMAGALTFGTAGAAPDNAGLTASARSEVFPPCVSGFGTA
jgi:hypothetical protein